MDRFRPLVEQLLKETDEDRSPLKSVEILRRARLDGYDVGKTALYELVAELRPRQTRVTMRFDGRPGECSQHDFGQVHLRYLDGTRAVVEFFGSRLKWSRWAAVDLVDGEDSETLVRTRVERFVRFGGVPLCAVFDRPKTVAQAGRPRRGHGVESRVRLRGPSGRATPPVAARDEPPAAQPRHRRGSRASAASRSLSGCGDAHLLTILAHDSRRDARSAL